MNNIVETIANEDLSLNELSEIVKIALSKIYTKVKNDVGIHNPIAFINSVGSKDYDIDIRFIDGECYGGECYTQTYQL
jgi:hypothetical protein